MKRIQLKTRTLVAAAMMSTIFFTNSVALGQSPGYDFDTTCNLNSTASGNCSFAQGSGSSATGNSSVAMGENADATDNFAIALGKGVNVGGEGAVGFGCNINTSTDFSSAIGRWLGSSSSSTYSYLFGKGIDDANTLENDISNSIMLGMNSTTPTVFIEDAQGTGSLPARIGRVGIGTTTPDGLLHLKDESADDTYMFIEKADATNGGIVWHNGAQAATTQNASLILDDDEDLILENNVSDKNIIFNINDNSSSTEVMRVVGETARVGIGATNPQAKLQVNADAVSGAELVARFNVDDALDDHLQVVNSLSAGNQFLPTLLGQVSSHNNNALRVVGSTENDAGTTPVMMFTSRITGSPHMPLSNRPLFRWNNFSIPVMQMNANGNLGIGTTGPSGKLDVNGTVFINYGSLPPGDFSGGSPVTDYILGVNSGTGQLLNLGASSIELKEDVEDIEFDKEAFLQLRPVDFKWKQFYGGQMDVGLIAQEVDQTFPALASYAYKRTYLPNGDFERDSLGNAVEDTTQMEVGGVRYHKLPVYLLALAKDQQQEIDELRDQVQNLTSIVQSCCSVEPSLRLGDDEQGLLNNEKDVEEYVLLRNDPNPFSDYTDIAYSRSNCNDCQIIIIDQNGRVVKRIRLNADNGTVRIYASEIGSGLFMYSLIRDGQVIRTEKMLSAR